MLVMVIIIVICLIKMGDNIKPLIFKTGKDSLGRRKSQRKLWMRVGGSLFSKVGRKEVCFFFKKFF